MRSAASNTDTRDERIYLLARKLERTPTHKIKFVRELERFDLSRFV